MSNYVLSCCSTADLSREHFESRDIQYVCFHYFLNGKEYADDLGQSIPFPQFYQAMRENADTRTAQVNADEYEAHFEKFLSQGLDVVHVCLSSGISGTINSAMTAAALLREKYPERKIFVIDSLGASSGYGLLMDKLADLRDQGMEVDALAAWAEENRLRLHHWFFSTDLAYYVKGGRISKSAGFIGGLLGICPLLNMDNEGRLIPRAKIPSKKLVRREMVARMEKFADKGLDYSEKCFLCHSDCFEDARKVADMVEARFPHLNGKVDINSVGTTIGSHTGPGTVALFFWGAPRVD